MVGGPLLSLRDVSASYDSAAAQERALCSVSLDIAEGEILFICGRNGSGKSTLLRAIAGTVEHDGQVHYTDRSGGQVAWENVRDESFSWVPQDVGDAIAMDLRIHELVSLTKGPTVRRLGNAIDAGWMFKTNECQQGEFSRRLVSELSGGERQLLVGMLALSRERRVVLLDESFRSLDIARSQAYINMLRMAVEEQGGCALVVSHDLRLSVDYGTRLIVLSRGSIAAEHAYGTVTVEDLAREIAEF